MTERGRMINLKQANYKSLKICGKTHHMKHCSGGVLSGPVFMGVARVVEAVGGEKQVGVFTTKHGMDMKFAGKM